MELLNFYDLTESGDRYILEEWVGSGVYGKVFSGKDTQTRDMKVAIKRQAYSKENAPFIQEEYRVLKDFCIQPNLPEFYGIFRSSSANVEELWFVMELYEGQIMDIVNGLFLKNRRMVEEHIAFVLKEVIKALIYLHENNIIHRDVRGSNVLLTKEGDIKLVDFGLAYIMKNPLDKPNSCLGSPSWMAPEVISAGNEREIARGFDTRADVWSLGVTALELGDGKSPFQNMHPTRAVFQIVKNPPPALNRPADWSEVFNDFVNECLVKNPEHRPFAMELIEHPFLTQIPEKNYYLTQELKLLYQDFGQYGKSKRVPEQTIHSNFLRKEGNAISEKMLVEDLCTLEVLNEGSIFQELQDRMANGQCYTFVGDVLLALNPNEEQDIYGEEMHKQYQFKSRSDNAPHIYSVADSAYQAALHHGITQHILLTGESSSGKTTNYLHLVDHLLYLGQNKNINQGRIKDAIKVLHAFTHASTQINDYSTRAIIRTEITYGSTGKNTGAVFEIFQLDKWRVSAAETNHPNFHIMYYFYDGLHAMGKLGEYYLDTDRKYRYLRIDSNSKSSQPRENPQQNIKRFEKIEEILKEFQFDEEQTATIWNALSAVLNLGDVRFRDTTNGDAEIENEEYAIRVAELLKLDQKKLMWALKNFCLRYRDKAERKNRSSEEACDARDTLANTLYCRIVQYVVNVINHKLSVGRALFGEKYSIKILDFYGFESFQHNHFPQFVINCTNEELHYYYLQKVFGWEAIELNEEGIPFKPVRYYNNKVALEEMLGKSGVLSSVDQATRAGKSETHITDRLQNEVMTFVNKINGSEFCVGHFTGKVTYESEHMPNHNRNFLPPEIAEVLRSSESPVIRLLFSSKLDRAGNVVMTFEDEAQSKDSLIKNENVKMGQYSQTKKIRTEVSIFKSFSLDLLKELSVGGSTGGVHFVRCIRSDLEGNPRGFHKEIVKQQLRAMAVLETAKSRKQGYPFRIPFPEFIRGYKFLAFEYDENVDVTKDNCRLLLIRLNMEGWVIGKTKVFLKYYNEEYLSRLYETQVQKIVRIQAMIRAYLAKRKMAKRMEKAKKAREGHSTENQNLTQEEAAVIVQKVYRGYAGRKLLKRLTSKIDLFDEELVEFIRFYYNKWRSKSIFQVLLQYRAAKCQDLYNLSQQIHLYNQKSVNSLSQCKSINLDTISSKAQVDAWLGDKKPSVLKLPFHLNDIPYFDTSFMCDPSANLGVNAEKDDEPWDFPLRWRETVSSQITSSMLGSNVNINNKPEHPLIQLPYNRNPLEPVAYLSTSPIVDLDDEKQDESYRNVPSSDTNYSEDDESKNAMENLNHTSTPANIDFEYIKSPSLKQEKRKEMCSNPIRELEIKGKRFNTGSEDDPPFNFQAMLRKTNFKRDSLKRDENGHKVSFKKKLRKTSPNEDEKSLKNEENNTLKEIQQKNMKEMEQKESPDQKVVLDKTINENNDLKIKIESIEHNPEKVIEELKLDQIDLCRNMKESEDVLLKDVIEQNDINKPSHARLETFSSTEICPGVFLEGIVINI